MIRVAIVCCLAVLACVRAAGAVPLTYYESESGDLSWPTDRVLDLDVGINLIHGISSYNLATGQIDHDSFIVDVPDGTRLTQFSYAITSTQGTRSGTGMQYGIWTWPSFQLRGLDQISWARVQERDAFSALFPLGPGMYAFSNSVLNTGQSAAASVSYTYRLTLESIDPVPPPNPPAVPEPATLTLLGLGLAGLAARRARGRVGRRRA